jgi:uncharacterized protein (UPF0261 family)
MGGLSTIDRPGLIFYLPEASEALFDTLKDGFQGTRVEVIRDQRHLCDPGFGEAAAALMDQMTKENSEKS